MDDILSERRLRWLRHVIQMDHQHVPRQALHWEVPGFKRGPCRPRTNWRSTVNKDLLRTESPGRKQRWQLKTDQNGVGVWPNASAWMRVKSRSRSRVLMAISHSYGELGIFIFPEPTWRSDPSTHFHANGFQTLTTEAQTPKTWQIYHRSISL